MNYKQSIKEEMEKLSQDEKVIFIGYNVLNGSKASGTLTGINEKQLIEMPLAENLMMGVAIGMALKGFKPIIYFERFDFILNAMDALINHLDKIKDISHDEFSPIVNIRIVVGNKLKPLYTGETHTSNYTDPLKIILKNTDIYSLKNKNDIKKYYSISGQWKKSSILV
jgi:pyruvate/2-oxoglutarate/acetoin dehydrogenase E1 component